MIELSGKIGDPEAKIRFTPRDGSEKRVEPLEFPLLWGHRCGRCGNVVNALFETHTEVDLFPYEATCVLSQGEKNAGEILKFVPNKKDKGNYESTMLVTPKGGLQRLRLKNHVARLSIVQDRPTFGSECVNEVGERTCPLTSIFSPREELLIKDLLLLFAFQTTELPQYNLPSIEALIPDPNGHASTDNRFRWARAIGRDPLPIIFVERQYLQSGLNWWLVTAMKPFLKPKTA